MALNKYFGAKFPLEDWYKRKDADMNYSRYKWMSRWVKGPRVLDFGCSHGSLVRFVTDKNIKDYLGVDANPKAVSAAENMHKHIDFAEFSTKIPDGAVFDTIVLGEVLEHQESPVELLVFLREHLDEGGVFVITVPHGFDEVSDHRQVFLTGNFVDTLVAADLGIVSITFEYGRILCVAHKGFHAEFPDADKAELALSKKYEKLTVSYQLLARRYEALSLTWILKGLKSWLISFFR